MHIQITQAITWLWTQDIHASTNLSVRDLTSTNLPARSPTPRTSPPVVQHTWSNNYEHPRSQQPSSVSTKHTNFPAHILTREHHNMNSRSYYHVFTTNHEPTHSWHSQASLGPSPTSQTRKMQTKRAHCSLRYRLALPKHRRAKSQCRPPGRHLLSPGASQILIQCF